MKKIALASILLSPMLAAACGTKGDEKLAQRVEDRADNRADMLENQADALDAQAKQVRATGESRSDAIDAANLNVQALSNEQRAAIVNNTAPAVR